MLTFALLDLPFESLSHNYKNNEGRGLDITPASSLILFKKEVKETTVEINNDLIVSHRYIQLNLNTQLTSQQNKAASDEFLIN